MGLIQRLRQFAFAHPHLLILQGARGTVGRLAAERWARAEGWPLADSPRDADIVVVCGEVGDRLLPLVDGTVDRVPLPRAVVRLEGGAMVEGQLQRAGAILLEWQAQRLAATAPDRAGGEPHHEPAAQEDHGDHGDEGGHEEANGRTDMAMNHTDMGMDHMHHMDMAMEAAGLPLPERREDRDGLKLDVLHVPLGPLLNAWPPGLELRLALQGDVVQEATVATPVFAHAGTEGSWWDQPWRRSLAGEAVPVATAERRRAAAHLDSLTRLLRVAGADGASRAAVRLRDAALAEQDVILVLEGATSLRRRLERSRLFRDATEGLGVLTSESAEAAGVTGPALRASGVARDARTGSLGYPDIDPPTGSVSGDVHGRCLQWLVEVEVALRLTAEAGEPLLVPVDGTHEGTRGVVRRDDAGRASRALAHVIPGLITGQELIAARLIVASLDPDGDDLAVAAADVGGLAHA